jgi:hypothetical protein
MDEYPNDSEALEAWQPEVPAERKETEADEKNKIASSIPLIEDTLNWLNAQADFYQTIDAIGVDASTPDDQVKIALIVAKKMRSAFQAKAAEFTSDFSQHIEKQERMS